MDKQVLTLEQAIEFSEMRERHFRHNEKTTAIEWVYPPPYKRRHNTFKEWFRYIKEQASVL